MYSVEDPGVQQRVRELEGRERREKKRGVIGSGERGVGIVGKRWREVDGEGEGEMGRVRVKREEI